MSIMLMDCDSFYASCEQLVNPALKGFAVCVLSNNDGCVVARSAEAKKMGIKMGMPAFMAKKNFPEAIYISGRLELYGEISSRVMCILKDFSPVVEIYSIDEAFIDLKGLRRLYRKPYFEIASDIRNKIAREVGIPVSIGISLTKTLAKLASERAKKSCGIYEIGFRDIDNELKHTSPLEIWGIGDNTASLMKKLGMYTAYDFVFQSDCFIKKTFGKRGLELKAELKGELIYPVINENPLPKSVQKTSSFAKFTSDEQYIKDSLYYHTHRACKKLRKLGLKAGVAGVMLRTKDFKVFYAKNNLLKNTNMEFEIFDTVNKLLPEIFMPNILYRSSGIILENLIPADESQLSLFSPLDETKKYENITRSWDKLEERYGSNIIKVGNYASKQ